MIVAQVADTATNTMVAPNRIQVDLPCTASRLAIWVTFVASVPK